MSMRILVRVDGGKNIGLGNVYRSLSMIQEIEETGLAVKNNILFLTGYDDIAALTVNKRNYNTEHIGKVSLWREVALQKKVTSKWRPDCVIVDVPEAPDRPAVFYDAFRWMNNPLLINLSDQNSGRSKSDIIVEGDIYYNEQPISSKDTKMPICLRGAKYWILNKAFAANRKISHKNKEGIFICFGGSDPANLSGHIGSISKYFPVNVNITLVTGKGFELSTDMPAHWEVLNSIKPSEMAEIMSKKRLGIISGGLMMYEAACVGLPSLVITQNEPQVLGAKTFSNLGVHKYLGSAETVNSLAIAETCSSLLQSNSTLNKMSIKGMRLVDGLGSKRLTEIIRGMINATI